MNINKLKSIVIIAFLFLYLSGCKSSEENAPCSRIDCVLTSAITTDQGIVMDSLTQTYTTVAGKKLIQNVSRYSNPLQPSEQITISSYEYDNKGKLTAVSTEFGIEGRFPTAAVNKIYEYDELDRLVDEKVYRRGTTLTSYITYFYNGDQTYPARKDSYDAQGMITGREELKYDENENLTEQVFYQGNNLYRRYTYSNYNAQGEWGVLLFEGFDAEGENVGITRKTTRTFEGCVVKTESYEKNGLLEFVNENTIVDGLVVSTETFDSSGETTRRITTFEYDCD